MITQEQRNTLGRLTVDWYFAKHDLDLGEDMDPGYEPRRARYHRAYQALTDFLEEITEPEDPSGT